MTPEKGAALERLTNHAVTCLAPEICGECIERRLCVRGVAKEARALGESRSILELVAWGRLDRHIERYRLSPEVREIRELNVAMWRHADPIREQLAYRAVKEARQGTT